MGRYISNAIITEMTIFRGKHSYLFKNDMEFMNAKEDILSEIGKEYNLDLFEVTYYDDAIKLVLKEQILQDNLFALIREFSKYVYPNSLYILDQFNISKKEFFSSGSFDEDKYHLHLEHGKNYKGEIDKEQPITIYCNDIQCSQMASYLDTYQYAMFKPNFKYFSGYENDISIYCGGVNFWLDFNKYDGEDETPFLRLLNIFSKRVIKNPLGNILLYHIDG